MENSALLLCDEELLPLSPSSSPLPSPRRWLCCSDFLMPHSDNTAAEDYEQVFKNYMQKESAYAPERGYAEKLHALTHLSTARCRAIRWVVLACGRLHLGVETAFNAVNYLDRFVSKNCCLQWEGWMMELLSIACLSIAAKYDEVVFPSLHEFQADEHMEHSFQPSTIQGMELEVLKALDWRLSCITPYSYIGLLMPSLHADALSTARTTELLLCVLLGADTKFMEYSAFVVAASALKCSLKEFCGPAKANAFISNFNHLIPLGSVDKCCKILTEAQHITDGPAHKYGCPPSPVTVIPIQRTAVYDCYVDIDRIFFNASKPNISIKKKPKRDTTSELRSC